MQVELHPVYLLHRRNYRETSLLLEVFSSLYGRVAVVAKGALRRSSEVGAIVQPFRPLLLSWTGRGGDLVTLTRCEAVGPALLSGGRALLCGFYLNELMIRTLPRYDPHPDIYRDYESALQSLPESTTHLEAILRVFEKQLLSALGYGLILDRDVESNKPIQPEGRYYYDLEQGPCSNDPEPPRKTVSISGAALLALASEQFTDAATLTEAKNLMRALLRSHIGEKPLYSRYWFEPQ